MEARKNLASIFVMTACFIVWFNGSSMSKFTRIFIQQELVDRKSISVVRPIPLTQCSMIRDLFRTEKEKPAAGKTGYWRTF